MKDIEKQRNEYAEKLNEIEKRLMSAISYPDDWDDVVFPTVFDALEEVYCYFKLQKEEK